MIAAVDEDGSNLIEFEEFLLIIKGKEGDEKTGKIKQFFKDMTNNKVGDPALSFYVNVQNIRRQQMMNAIILQKREMELEENKLEEE